jgi:CHAT domain-containing protein/tetratricopeptide (TPR) repeat protein
MFFLAMTIAATWCVVVADCQQPTPDEYKKLEAQAKELTDIGVKAHRSKDFKEAERAFAAALAITRRLTPKEQYPKGLDRLARCLTNLAYSLEEQQRLAEAELLYRENLQLHKDWGKRDHAAHATTLHNLGQVLGVQGGAERLLEAEPLLREAVAMRRRLFKGNHAATADSLNNLGIVIACLGSLSEAAEYHSEALAMRRRLFQGDNRDTAASLNNLGNVLSRQGKIAEAAEMHEEALAMRRRLFNGDNLDTAASLHNLGNARYACGKLTEAESLSREALDMRRRLLKRDHPDIASSLNGLGAVLRSQGKAAYAKLRLEEALEMWDRLPSRDQVEKAGCLVNLAMVHLDLDGPAAAEPALHGVLEMQQRLFKGDHPDIVTTLINLGFSNGAQGKPADAERWLRQALAMSARIRADDHPTTSAVLTDLALAVALQGKLAEAEALFRDAARMDTRLIESYAARRSEGDALNLLVHLAKARDAFLAVGRARKTDSRELYAEIWLTKSAIARVFEQRHFAARATATHPDAAKILSKLSDLRRRRADLLLEPANGIARDKRDGKLKELSDAIARLDADLRSVLPPVGRMTKLATATLADLQNALPPDGVVVDFIRFLSWAPNVPVIGSKVERRYLAFVITRDRVASVDLGPAEPIESAITAWREAITAGTDTASELPDKVRGLIWQKVRKQITSTVKTVYVAPDVALCRVPWPALPGDEPNTILLEDFALAVIPHAPFLLDKLWPQKPHAKKRNSVLIVGGVAYDAEAPSLDPLTVNRAEPLLKTDHKAQWKALEWTEAEAMGVGTAAAKKTLDCRTLRGKEATVRAVLAALPESRQAHLATHGFFADPSFRSAFHVDPAHFEKSLRGERVGYAALSPMVMTGLVFAGANKPSTPGRGIITGEALIDIDLSGLELAVLSACETGLGDVADGEGTFALQRAFHLAGTRDVVASLWKVPDRATAALMALFYRNLWEKDMPPVEALRQAQLEIYRNPQSIAKLADGFRGTFKEVPGTTEDLPKTGPNGRAHPRLWAAFTLSGLGR